MSWTDKVTNDEVLGRAGVRRELMGNIERRQLQFLGNILRARGLERDCLLERISRKKAKGRQGLKMHSQFNCQNGENVQTSKFS